MTKKELEKELQKMKAENCRLQEVIIEQATELAELKAADAADMSFCEYYRLWLERHKQSLQPNTYEEYKAIAENHILPYFSKKGLKLKEVTAEHIEKYYFSKMQSGLSANSVIHHHANIFTAFKYALKQGYISKNPMTEVSRPKCKNKYIPHCYTAEQLTTLLEISQDSVIFLPIVLAVFFGLRRSEIVGLKWDAVNFQMKTLTIKRKAYRSRTMQKDIVTGNMKNFASSRVLPIPNNLLEFLKHCKQNQSEKLRQSGTSNAFAEFVCTNSEGKRISLSVITANFRRLLEKHSLPHIRFHDLRHSCATLLLHLGYDIKVIQAWLGHANFQTTANIYTHVDLRDKENVSERLNKLLKINFR